MRSFVLLSMFVVCWKFSFSATVPLPARIEAENFVTSSGLSGTTTSDDNGGKHIGWINDGNWMKYNVSVATAGIYKFNIRVANGFSDEAKVLVKNASGTTLSSLQVPRTGGMNSWKTVPFLVTLPAGNQTLTLHIEKGVISINWFEALREVKPIPGKIQAEEYAVSTNVTKENTADVEGGLNLTDIDNGDWMDYVVSVAEASNYTFMFRVANSWGDGIIQIKNASDAILGTYSGMPRTGGWQSWTTVSVVVPLAAGEQTLRIFAAQGAFNLNWIQVEAVSKQPTTLQFATLVPRTVDGGRFELTATSNHTETPILFSTSDASVVSISTESGKWYATPLRVGSASITASQSSSLGYQAATSISHLQSVQAAGVASASLPGRVEIENFVASSGLTASSTSDPQGGGSHVSWIGDENWLDYQVNVATSGYYLMTFRVTNGFSDEARITLKDAAGTQLGSTLVPRTGGMNSWGTAKMLVYLPAGEQTLRVAIPKGVISLNWFEGYQYLKPIPGQIEAESFDIATRVTSESTQDGGTGVNITDIDDNDWLDYNVMVASAGTYALQLRVANSYGNGVIEIQSVTGQVLAEISVPRTGGWQSWTTIQTTISLPAGNQVLRVYARLGAFNLNWIEFSNQASQQAPSVIQFSALSERSAGSAPFLLAATSNNTESPIVFTSSNPSIVSISNSAQGTLATPLAPGSATITASQSGSTNFLAAQPVARVQVVTEAASSSAQKIPIDPKRWYILNNTSNGLDGMFDGQTQVNVHLGYGTVLDTFDAYYPLLEGESISLEKIKMFDFQGIYTETPFTLSAITSDWTRVPVATFTGTKYDAWVGPYPDRGTEGEARFNLDAPIQGIRYLVMTIRGGLPTELELYGSYTASTVQYPAPSSRAVKLKDMMGINAYEWNFQDAETPWQINESKMGMVKSFTGVRHYMDWQKLESSQGVYSYNPTLSGGWHYDQIYERCKAEGIEVVACLKTLPDWMVATYPEGQRDHENVPVRYGMPFHDPNSYLEQAKMGFQYAARYGSNTQVDPALLSVHSTPRWNGDNPNTIKIGMNLIKYIECDNERDKWWKGRKAYQTAREYCANLSAFYDGHKNTMGPGVGVKNADPNMQVVIGGLVSGPEYIRGMVDWCKEFRGYKANGEVNLCWDVINYHIYTDNTSSSQSGTSTRGAAPEVTNANERTEEFVQVSDRLCYGMPVWITETGFDINQGSPLKAVPIGNRTAEETQADWILRTSLFSARHGIQKVFFYQMYDDNNSGVIFSTSGLINSNLTRRPAADFLAQTTKLVGDYVYAETTQSDPIVDRYVRNGANMFVVVVPDEVGRTAPLNLQIGNFATATIYKPRIGSNTMEYTQVAATNGVISIVATETPQFVIPGPAPSARTSSEVEALTSDLIGDTPNEDIVVFPNPLISDNFQLVINNTTGMEVEVKLFDAARGILFKSLSIPAGEKVIKRKVTIPQLPTGEYILDVRQRDKRSFKKVVYLK